MHRVLIIQRLSAEMLFLLLFSLQQLLPPLTVGVFLRLPAGLQEKKKSFIIIFLINSLS